MINSKGVIVLVITIICLTACRNTPKIDLPDFKRASGATMGTTYHITYKDTHKKSFKAEIDSLLFEINASVSTYIPSSTISIINTDSLAENITVLENGDYKIYLKYDLPLDHHFIKNFEISQSVYRNSKGYFDPTVMPLVNYWGFGFHEKKAVTKVDSQKVNAILNYIGFNQFTISKSRNRFTIIKQPFAQLDFSAVAKGYAVDHVSQFLLDNGCEDFMVEIGGEVFVAGLNKDEQKWKIGLNQPERNAKVREFQEIISLSNNAVASSGNYRNFYDVNGVSYGHEINPTNGYPEKNSLLGVSVVSESCASSDAYATAFMIMGLKKSENLVEELENLEACFFYRNDSLKISKSYSLGFDKFLSKME